MIGFLQVTGIAAPFTAPNIDTDIIMPKQFLKGVDRQGLDLGAFHDLRFDEQGKERPEFILNQPAWKGARFLITGPNFGCGSSREHAVWGLSQLGFRALVGTSFAGIFNDNCARNGILTITLPAETVSQLASCAADPGTNQITVDLARQKILADGTEIAFEIEPLRKDALMRGLDAVSLTLEHSDDIRRFEADHFSANPWFDTNVKAAAQRKA